MRTLCIARTLVCLAATVFVIVSAEAQTVHYQYSLELPPGAIGQRIIQSRPHLAGFMQPVEMRVPGEALVSVAIDGAFSGPYRARITAALEVGRVYRFELTQIPKHPTKSLYPTVELMDRLHPPAGMDRRYPIRIVIPQEDIDLAIQGRFVTRVIYLENPQDAFPSSDSSSEQRYFDTLPGENPIQVADQLGRPMAIVRIGSRTPNGAADDAFLFGSPPILIYQSAEPAVVDVPTPTLAPVVDAPQDTDQRLPVSPGFPEPEASDEPPETPEGTGVRSNDLESQPSPLDLNDTLNGEVAPADELLNEFPPNDGEVRDEVGPESDPDGVSSDIFDFEGLDE